MKRRASWINAAENTSCGNAGAVESVESQKQASHSFHEPLGNLAQRRQDSHIPTARAKPSGKVENQKQVFHFPVGLRDYDYGSDLTKRAGGLRPRRTALRAASGVIVVDRGK
jgi:hypothetical protein